MFKLGRKAQDERKNDVYKRVEKRPIDRATHNLPGGRIMLNETWQGVNLKDYSASEARSRKNYDGLDSVD